MKTNKILFIALMIIGGSILQTCSSDDNSADNGNNCSDVTDQLVQGNFRGTSFVSPAGFYKDFSFGGASNYRIEIYVKERTSGDCLFPVFDGTQDNILFSIPSLDTQTINFEDSGSNTLNFNRIVNGTTEVELATCGTAKITNYNTITGELQGTVIAVGRAGSMVDGNFTIQFCDN